MVFGVMSWVALFHSGVTAVGMSSFWGALSILRSCSTRDSDSFET